ncbi:Coagulation factor IX [Folsomia candida]|uniref:Coagulation factor IX n=1 Tax=Folsomia candida TaxID=158441 RepID=A0A226F1X1_FOLCA|nr:Coagulation factor IX [Folsomia candida]
MSIRIPRATDGVPGYAPYQVQMVYSSTNQPNCGGAIINAFFILTAAHCLTRPGSRYEVEDYRDPSEILVVAGKYTTSGYDETQQTRKIQESIGHPEYTDDYWSHDIALVRVSHPLKFNRYVQPIQMAMDFRQFTGQASLYGFGITKVYPGGRSQYPETSQVSSFRIISHSECKKIHNVALYDVWSVKEYSSLSRWGRRDELRIPEEYEYKYETEEIDTDPTTTTPIAEDDPTTTTPITENDLPTTTSNTDHDPPTTTPIMEDDLTTENATGPSPTVKQDDFDLSFSD